MIKEAFVYCWTDHKTDKLYIGSHKGTQDDGYVCSSKLMLEQYKERPDDFTRQIIAEGLLPDIRKLEAKILDSFNVKEDAQFYNQHNGNGDFYCKGHSEKTKKQMSEAKKDKPQAWVRTISKEHAEKLHKGRRESKNSKEHINAIIKHHTGKKASLETRKKQSKSAKNRDSFTEEHRKNLSIKTKERWKDPEYRRIMSEMAKSYWAQRRAEKNS